MTQESVRERLINYMEDNGSTLTFIGKKIHLPTATVCEFREARKELYPETLVELDEFLKSKNY